MSRNDSIGRRSKDGGFSFVSFVKKGFVLAAQNPTLANTSREDQNTVKPGIYDQTADNGPAMASPSSSKMQESNTSRSTSYNDNIDPREDGNIVSRSRSSNCQRVSTSTDPKESTAFQVTPAAFDESHHFHGASFSKEIAHYKDGPEDSGVIACGIFLKSYEPETRYSYSKDKSGPRIDSFFEFYIGDHFTTVEQRTKADFEYLNRRALGIAVGNVPENITETGETPGVIDHVTGQLMLLPQLLELHEFRVKKTYKKELLAENSTFMKRLEATLWDKWNEENSNAISSNSNPGSQSRIFRQEAEHAMEQLSAVQADDA
ncbi:hypothetical protein ONS95_012083 [Cadophora gregata]|uniref:uncharacterized protein n=1 Tax=Cadophora gregata TaxID=51156 RepID=UPI0026DAE274|nr:uncharacterized protein ONS95_012083 [Cadophora gregata]KAK0117757.1 hypothetical protein ONS95_012083 [Cadophora gregata]KAK0122806.1 hypothetical protein ONS96_009840 [Cadophora gregata f. sp. sojae]